MIFHETVFGPIHSRRLGTSLGINLMPNDGKLCSFDCVYCEAGLNSQGVGKAGVPSRQTVHRALTAKLQQLRAEGATLNSITFSGNGEPTLHPEFAAIVGNTISLRDTYFPEAKVSVLSNATTLHRQDVVDALKRVDNNILKLDSAVPHTMRLINRPASTSIVLGAIIDALCMFDGKCIVQTMMLRGTVDGHPIDNTTDEEVAALLAAYRRIGPRLIQLYSIDRKPPLDTVEAVGHDTLEAVAEKLRAAGLTVQVN